LKSKTLEIVYGFLEELASNNYQWPFEKAIQKKKWMKFFNLILLPD
jgi:hypothetical protein